MAQAGSSQTVHDDVIIGSGAGGGTVTKVLTDLGISVLLMEAGPMLAMSDLKEHMWPHQAPNRGTGPHAEAYSGRATGFTYSSTFGGA
jgi:choline dehydrogenase-like flavoprotein